MSDASHFYETMQELRIGFKKFSGPQDAADNPTAISELLWCAFIFNEDPS